mgnify:CR=1
MITIGLIIIAICLGIKFGAFIGWLFAGVTLLLAGIINSSTMDDDYDEY